MRLPVEFSAVVSLELVTVLRVRCILYACSRGPFFSILELTQYQYTKITLPSLSLSLYPFIVARQRLGTNPFIVAMRRLSKYPHIIARHPLGRNVTAVTNTHATIEEFLDASFSMWPVSYQGK
jgi:hypothetical protein